MVNCPSSIVNLGTVTTTTMLANTMHSAAAQAMRACGRTLPAVQSLSANSAASRVVLARHAFLITPSYKARIAARGYVTATATKTKPKPRTAAATAGRKPAAKKAPVKAKATKKAPVKAKAKPKAKPKKKAVAKKPVKKVVKKVKKEPSEAKKAALLKRDLKKIALFNGEPPKLPYTNWLAYTSERHEGARNSEASFGERIKSFSVDFKNLPASEISVSHPCKRPIFGVYLLTIPCSVSSRCARRTLPLTS